MVDFTLFPYYTLNMTPEQYQHLVKEGYNRIPVVRKILADLDTPLGVYLKMADQPYSYFLESVQGGEKWGRYSIIGMPCRTIIKISGYDITVLTDNKVTSTITVADPLAWIDNYQKQFHVPVLENLPLFTGGLVGYFGYDTVRYIEPRLGTSHLVDPLATPDILLMVSENLLVFDNLSCQLYLITHCDPSQNDAFAAAQQQLDELERQLQTRSLPNKSSQPSGTAVTEDDLQSNQTFAEYAKNIRHIKQYIEDGEAMQVVYSRRISIPYLSEPIDLYRALRHLNPSPYMYYLNLDDFYIVGSSPEILVRLEDGTVTLRPIAGTRPRGKTKEEDNALEKDLLEDKKELAEHLMLIDLGRNDVGRIAQTGSVQLTEKMCIERYSHVMHIVSNVIGKLKPNLSAMDVLRATFPAGTLSGAPKVRAMEIIEELEPIKRGIYGGAIGYLAWNGNLDTAIAIRTGVIKDKILTTQVGGGIVADSTPEYEWDETCNKSRAILRAAALVARGL